MRPILAFVVLSACSGVSLPLPEPGQDAHPGPGTGSDGGPHADARVDALHPDSSGLPDAGPSGDGGLVTDPLQGLPTGTAAWQQTCGRHYGDAISAAFCAGASPPPLTSITDLEALLGLVPNGDTITVSLAAETTGLGMRGVTDLVPRAFVMTAPHIDGSANPSLKILSFARGEPMVELVANDPAANTLRFFLIRFELPCTATGCGDADLLTPSVESGWVDYSLYDDKAVADTTLDCLACHQPGGPGAPKLLRMQEISKPWDHWFYDQEPSGHALIDDFVAAHGSESYAGIPANLIRPSLPQSLELVLETNGFAAQSDAFNSAQIEAELAATGTSATWNGLYAKSVAGTALPTSYFGVPHTDAAKTASMIDAYQRVMAGTLPRAMLPDLRDAVRDDALAQLSIRPEAGLDGHGVMKHMCRTCHNGSLDQTLSRSYFNVDTVDQLSAYEKGLAIQRLMLGDDDAHKMPPPRFHTLSDAERAAVVAALQ